VEGLVGYGRRNDTRPRLGRPAVGWQLPECYQQLRRLLEAQLKKHDSREYVKVLRLLETFAIDEVTHAIEDALQFGMIGFDAVNNSAIA